MKDYIEAIIKLTLENYRCETIADAEGRRVLLAEGLSQAQDDDLESARAEVDMLVGDLAQALLPVAMMLHTSAGLLKEAAQLFRRYEELHRAKGTEDSTKKAEVNAAMALRIEELLLQIPDHPAPAWTEDQIADACIKAEVPDSKYEAILVALKG